ncbi:MAG TPA: ATP-binding protein [Aridibacter sp.]|nr:ATP-binding protein [Aridibacter sp.]
MKGKVLTSWSLVWLLAAVVLIAAGALNLSQRAYNQLPPTDGVEWVQKDDGIYAVKVKPGFAASRAGIAVGDRLIGIGFEGEKVQEITLRGDVILYLETAGVGGNLTYFYQRPSWSFSNNFYYADLRNIDSVPRWTANYILLTVVGCIWLLIGVFVLFKQGSRSPFILHFATLCLAAFVFHIYNPLGLGEDFDLGVALLDNLAFAFFAPLFLHFCLRYPVRSEVFEEARWKTIVLYVPALLISGVYFTMSLADLVLPTGVSDSLYWAVIAYDIPTVIRNVTFYHFVAGISLGAGVLCWRFFKNRKPLVRQRLKWAMWGTIVAVIPILLLQTAKRFIYISDDSITASLTILPLALIPLSFGHSVVRYRLMDVDVVVRRAFVYALTTVTIAMMIGAVALGLVFLAIGNNLSNTEIALRAIIAVVAMGAIIMLSEPLKNFLQERVERYFYGEKYDLRRGLLDFGKTLSASTALQPLLDGLTVRLQQVLDVEKVAVFIEDQDAENNYRIAKSVGLSDDYQIPSDFKMMIRQKSAKKGVVRADEFALLEGDPASEEQPPTFTFSGNGNGNGNGHLAAIVRQELHYYVPCVVRGRMVAVIGLGRARDGSLLSSEDIGIIQTISGYVAVAIENTLLYQEQETRAGELALLKEFNESIVESVNVGLIAVDEGGLITRCNTSFEQMFGFSRAEAVGRLAADVFRPEFAESLDQVLGKSSWHLTEIRNAYKVETRRPDGEPLILNVAIAPLRSPGGSQNGAIVVLENVTSRVKLEEGLQQNEKLSSIGLLAAGVAHEVNTPLTGVSSYTQMLLGMIPESDPKHELLQKVHKQTERASNIVGNLLNFSRAGNAGEFTEVDVNKLLDDTLQLLEPQIRKSKIEIVRGYSKVPLKIDGNPGKLQQVFTNLIINAQDAILHEGSITLETELDSEGMVIVRISDTGDGIDPEDLSKIYDPFFTTKPVGSGTGLGMAVSYGIVQEHSGTIAVRSEKGVGTTFEIAFPASARKPQKIAS